MKHIIYLDCDQVLADFVAGACNAVGYDYPGTKNWPDGWTYNFFKYAGTTREKVDKHCTIDFWANLPWMDDGKEILAEVLNRFFPHQIMVLTTPMNNDESYSGKALWFEKHIPELHRRIIPTHIEKHEFAHDTNHILIDDYQSNVERFIQAGGSAILVPRPWNYNEDIYRKGLAVDYIAKMLNRWIKNTHCPTRKDGYRYG